MKEEQLLPRFRRDLKIFRGPEAEDGSPTYSLYDPVTAQYYQIGWAEGLVFKTLRPGMTAGRLIEEIEKHSTLRISLDDVEQFLLMAARMGLLESKRLSDQLMQESEQTQLGWWRWLFSRYLYIRLPLINPDRFLERTLPLVRPLISPFALFLYGVLVVLGLGSLLMRFDEFLYTFPYFFNWQGALFYAIAIIAVKIVHELAHAYVAKGYGVHVPSMGVAFLVFWPRLYTDVTDSWKLYSRNQRMAISGAGIVTELAIAGLATLGWSLSTSGIWHSIFFVIASVSWVSTLLVNINPALRWDGYYLLCDFWGIDNLHQRSFAMARWQLRRWLLGLELPCPEPECSLGRRRAMVAFSLYAWAYRLFLYTVIALFIYNRFTKTLGVLLLAGEIYLLVVEPVVSEMRQWMALRRQFRFNLRLNITVTLVVLLAFWFFVPLPHRLSFSAITVPTQEQVLYVPLDSQVEEILVTRGDHVVAQQPLVLLRSEGLNNELERAEVERDLIEKQLDILIGHPEVAAFIPQKQAELAALESKIEGLKEREKQLTLRSSLSGVVYVWDSYLKKGQYLSQNHIVARVAAPGMRVVCYVPERWIGSFEEGQEMSFVLPSPRKVMKGRVVAIRPIRSLYLEHPALASVLGGDLPTVSGRVRGTLLLVESYYTITLELENPPKTVRLGQPGHVEVRGPWRSYFLSLLRRITALFVRESGF